MIRKEMDMGQAAKALTGTILLMAFFLLTNFGSLQAQTEEESPPPASPNLAEIIPLANDLSGRLAQLNLDILGSPDVSKLEEEYAELERVEQEVAAQLERIKGAGEYNWVRLEYLIRKLRYEKALAKDIGIPLASAIRRLAGWRDEWLGQKEKWGVWESRLIKDRSPDQLRSAFSKGYETIDTALDLVLQQLDYLLRIQARGGAVVARIDALDAKAQALISAGRREYLFAASPPILSSAYFSQFGRGLWPTTLNNLGTIEWPSARYFSRHRLALTLQIVLVLVIIYTLLRNRQALRESEQWRFLADRPLSSGLFVGVLIQLLYAQYLVTPVSLMLIYTMIGWLSFTRLLAQVIEQPWKKQAAFGVIIFFVISRISEAVGLPLPLYRLYIVLAALLSFFICLRWTRERIHNKDNAAKVWLLRLASFLLAYIILEQLLSAKGKGVYLFSSLVSSLAITFAFALFIRIIRGFLQWVFFSSPVWKIKQLRSEAFQLVRWVSLLVEFAIGVYIVLPIIFIIWGLYGSMAEARGGLLEFGFDAGSLRISVGLVMISAATLYTSFLLSKILPKVLLDDMVAGSGMERGARISVGRLIQYFIVFIGFLLTLTTLGLDLTKLTIMLSALGVGIGFGLQGVVNNFVSGIILLFEQPVRIGDSIEVSGKWAEIKNIGLRATTVQTVDKAELIVPNADLVSSQVTNWTLSNRQVRLTVPVGVAYGSDVPLVFATLLACAGNHEMVAKSPPPQVLFMRFGDSSLDFELRVWVTDVDNRLSVSSDLHQEIDRRFREAKIEIAYPQRDLHLRSIDKSITVPPQQASG